MDGSNSMKTPDEKLDKATEDSEFLSDVKFQSAVGSLLCLATHARSDMSYAVGSVARFCSKPTTQHGSRLVELPLRLSKKQSCMTLSVFVNVTFDILLGIIPMILINKVLSVLLQLSDKLSMTDLNCIASKSIPS